MFCFFFFVFFFLFFVFLLLLLLGFFFFDIFFNFTAFELEEKSSEISKYILPFSEKKLYYGKEKNEFLAKILAMKIIHPRIREK